MKYKKVQIEWLDSKSGPSGWEYKDELSILEPTKCLTLGFMLEDRQAYKVIAQSISDTQIYSRIAIPTECIVNIKIWEE